MEIIFLPVFKKEIDELPERIRKMAEKKLKIFLKDPFEKSLKTHKLKGNLNWMCSFWINRDYRIGFEVVNKKTVRLYYARIHDKMYKK